MVKLCLFSYIKIYKQSTHKSKKKRKVKHAKKKKKKKKQDVRKGYDGGNLPKNKKSRFSSTIKADIKTRAEWKITADVSWASIMIRSPSRRMKINFRVLWSSNQFSSCDKLFELTFSFKTRINQGVTITIYELYKLTLSIEIPKCCKKESPLYIIIHFCVQKWICHPPPCNQIGFKCHKKMSCLLVYYTVRK